jgi:short-subunit dehydrogenase
MEADVIMLPPRRHCDAAARPRAIGNMRRSVPVRAHALDLANGTSIADIAQRPKSQPIDILLHNAGMLEVADAMTLDGNGEAISFEASVTPW